MFVPGKPLQTSLTFVDRATAYLFACSTLRYVHGLTHNHETKLERLTRDKHSSLVRTFVNYSCKKFCNIGLGKHNGAPQSVLLFYSSPGTNLRVDSNPRSQDM